MWGFIRKPPTLAEEKAQARMRRMPAVTRSLLFLTAGVGALVIAGCDSAGPVHPWRVQGTPFAVAGTLGVYRGQTTDFEAYVVNDAHGAVTVTGARLIRLPGYRSARLVHVGIETGKGHVGIDRDWPPQGVAVRPLIGASLPHGRVYLSGGIAAARPGTYLAAGLHLTYRTSGRTYQTDAWGGGASCVAPGHPGQPPGCRHADRLMNAIMDYIHQH